jgi:hypothetical protein
VASILAVLALHSRSLEKELAAEGTEDDGVELLRDEFVTVLLVDRFLALADGALTAETTALSIEGTLADVRLDCRRREEDRGRGELAR